MVRAIVLSIALLVGLGTIIPLTTDYTEAGAQKPRKQKKKKQVKYKKYSRQWWRAYRQRVKRNKQLAQRRRAMRLRQIRLSRTNPQNTQAKQTSRVEKDTTVKSNVPALLPSGETAPLGWKQGNASSSELNYRVEDESGSQIGSASISLVGAATTTENQPTNSRNKTVGGVSVNSFRSTVIDRMIKENGWVVNDYQKEIGGKKVYVVVAQSEGAGGVILTRTFYFTEVDGRIYSVATTSPTNSAEKITQESEKVIDSLQRTKTNPQQASNEKE